MYVKDEGNQLASFNVYFLIRTMVSNELKLKSILSCFKKANPLVVTYDKGDRLFLDTIRPINT